MDTFKGSKMLFIGVVLVIGVIGLLFLMRDDSSESVGSTAADTGGIIQNMDQDVPSDLRRSALNVDYSESSIPLAQVLSGGPRKDGIPALTNPSFTQLGDASGFTDEVQVMVVEHGGETKIYPYNILTFHEIVNDTVGGKDLAVTFCPLCGSAIVYEREIDGETIDFGVSGFLYESNLLMYSREDDESLWSQSRGEAVVGTHTGTKLTHYPTQVMTFGDAKDRFPDALVMNINTGSGINYDRSPYAGYEDDEGTIFPISVNDRRFPAKEVFYIVPLEGNSIAVRQDKADGTYDVPDTDIKVTFDRGVITAKWGEAELPGYFEMWFSWAVHHAENGIVVD